jgi:hypothetical protein
MAEILTRCPETGRAIPTGIKTEWVEFASLPPIRIPVRCPECGTMHTWTIHNAWIDRGNLSLVNPD